jgi:hypothetical protein
MKIGSTTWLKYEFPNYGELQLAAAKINPEANFELLGGQEIEDEKYIMDALWYNDMPEPEEFKPFSINPETSEYLIEINGWIWSPDTE